MKYYILEIYPEDEAKLQQIIFPVKMITKRVNKWV